MATRVDSIRRERCACNRQLVSQCFGPSQRQRQDQVKTPVRYCTCVHVKSAIYRPEERRAERGSALRSSLNGGEKAIVNIGTVSNATLGNIPERQGRVHVGFPERADTIINGTVLNWTRKKWNQQQHKLHIRCER